MRTGIHTSMRKGFAAALQDAVAEGCNTFQMFAQSPRGWKTRVYSDEEFHAFREARKESGISPVVVHAPYLPNLCTSDVQLYERSVGSLVSDLERCEKLGAEFLVIHPGAFSPDSKAEVGLQKIVSAINVVLKKVPGTSKILIENMGGGGRRLGGRFEECRDILLGINDQARMGICFDTCHAWAAGYDVSNESAVKKTLDEFDKTVGISRIHVFHVNDAKGELGGHRDLHEHIGQGKIGFQGFRALFKNPQFKDCAYILETPKDVPDADRKNLKALRACLPSK